MDRHTIITKEKNSKLIFKDYKIEKINFKSNPDYKFGKPIDIEFSLHNEIDISENENSNDAIITLNCIVFKDAIKKNFPFELDIVISGNFTLDGKCDKDTFLKFCKINGTAILFPFLRTAITNITGTSNLPPLVLPLVNIHNIIEQKK